jgi:hypothetical protein
VDNFWEQEKLEATKMLENDDESHLSSARCVSPDPFCAVTQCYHHLVLIYEVGNVGCLKALTKVSADCL